MEYYAQRIIDGLEPHEGESIARGLEDEIDRRGLWRAYTLALVAPLLTEDGNIPNETPMIALHTGWLLIRATPEQRARAFLKAVE